MTEQHLNFERIKKAIGFISENYKSQPSLEEIAASVQLSPYHFQRIFSDWVGISPKQFLQYISVEHAKNLLKETHTTLFDSAHEVGLSGTSRLHDLFVKIEAMTPGEYKNGGAELSINYSFGNTPFGKVIVASTQKGICHMAFLEDEDEAFNSLKRMYPNAGYKNQSDILQQNALTIFSLDWQNLPQIKLHIKGSEFQLKVWEVLLKIPMGNLTSYGDISQLIKNPQASRAVGTAIGSNPIAFLIPCHRVVRSTGVFGGYMWGKVRKTAIIGWESAITNKL